jgi:hypothetical protein
MTQYENVDAESIPKGILGGVIAALIGAIIQGAITAASHMEFGLIAVGIGYLAALGVRFMGNGSSSIFGIIGAICGLFGALAGQYIAFSLMVAKEMGGSYADGFSFVSANLSLLPESIGFMSWLFIGIATYCGYKYSTSEE